MGFAKSEPAARPPERPTARGPQPTTTPATQAHLLIDMEQKRVSEFLLNIFLVAAFNATGYANFSIVELDRAI